MGTPGQGEPVSMESLFKEIREMRTAMDQNDAEHSNKLDSIQKTIDPMSQQLEKHSTAISYLNYDSSRKNLLIFNLTEQQDETLNVLIGKVLDLFTRGLRVSNFTIQEIDSVKRLGPKSSVHRARPIMVKLVSQFRKSEILKNVKYLKNSGLSVQPDYPPEVREKRKQLVNEMKTLRSQGKYAYIKYDKLVVLDKIPDRNPLKRLPSHSPEVPVKKAYVGVASSNPVDFDLANLFSSQGLPASQDIMMMDSSGEINNAVAQTDMGTVPTNELVAKEKVGSSQQHQTSITQYIDVQKNG
uniref:Uncharacterized protein n=1 Tax=Cacopsylla melanoneura TaxID=428564 RepID=A0A8D9FDL5_9HEMI